MKIEDFANNIFPRDGSAFEVGIRLNLDPQDPNSFKWSFRQEKKVDMGVGTFCSVQIVTRRRSIYRFLFENVRETVRKAELWLE